MAETLPINLRRDDRRARLVLAVAAVAAFVSMPVWRGGLSGDAIDTYAIEAEAFDQKIAVMVAAHADGVAIGGGPVVRPPAGDVFMAARQWQFDPVVELEAGKSYRLHVAAMDVAHGVAVDGREVLLLPGRAAVLELKPQKRGRLEMKCSEFCGSGHNKMTATLEVVSPRQ